MSLSGNTVVVGISGSIAAYKACEVVRHLKDRQTKVHCVMTESARQFITPLTLAALSQNAVAENPYDPALWEMAHLQLAQDAKLVVVVPASANVMARLAQGLANDLLTTLILATQAPVLLVPAMHETMWKHPLTQQNVAALKKVGYHVLGPITGKLADGRVGMGHLAEVGAIVAEAERLVS